MNHNRSKPNNLCWLLVKNRLLAQLGINTLRYEKDPRKKTGKIMVCVAIILCLIMLVGYCGGMAYGFAIIGLTDLIPIYAMIISSILTLVFSLFKANGEFFAFKDFDMVLSLPIPVRTIVNSRFLNMYLWNTFFTILIMLPMGSVYAIKATPALSYYVMWFFSLFVISLIPTTIAAIFGTLLTAISSKFKYSSLASTILSMLFIVLILGFSMTSTSTDIGIGALIDPKTNGINTELVSKISPLLTESMLKVYPPAKLYQEALLEGTWSSFFLFSGLSILWYILFIFLLSLKYREVNTAITSHKTKSDYKIRTLQQQSMLMALYKKNLLRILKSTICVTNLLIGCIIAILFSIALVIIGPEQLFQSMDMNQYSNVLHRAAPFLIAAIITMSNTACVSLALEGKNIWIIKSLPISSKTLYDSYILVNLTFTIPTSIICGILFSIGLKSNVIETLFMILTPLVFSLWVAVVGIFVGNRMAYYDWQEEVQIVKQSLMSLIGMLGGMVFTGICGVLVSINILPIPTNLLIFLINGLLFILTVMLYLQEGKRTIKE